MRKWKIKTKLILILAVVLVLGFVSTNLASYLVSEEAFRTRSLDETLPLISNNIYSEIQADIMRPIHISSLMAHDTFLKDWALAGEADLPAVVKYLEEIKQRYGFFTSFFVSALSKKYYSCQGLNKTVSPRNAHDAWYFKFIASALPFDLDVDTDEVHQGRLTIFINHRVRDYAGKLLGVAGVGLNMDRVGKILASYQSKYQRAVYMVDANGLVQLHSQKGFIQKASLARLVGSAQLAKAILADKSGTNTYEDQRAGKTVLLATRYFADLDWFMIVEQGEGVSPGAVRSALYSNLAVGGLITLFIIFAVVVVVNRYQGQLETLSTIDDLTQVPNRRYFMESLKREMLRAARYGHPLSLMMIDADHFKAINDCFGHDGGDQTLVNLGATLKFAFREVDLVGRLGGEEFAALMPNTGPEEAQAIAERIRKAVEQSALILGGNEVQLTVSIGVASLRGGEVEGKQLLKRADEALYRAKEAGRNRVMADGPEPERLAWPEA